jgi:head-tail adaptor
MVRAYYMTISKPTFTTDSQGGVIQTLQDFWKGWGKVEFMSYAQANVEGLPLGQQPVKVQIRKNELTERFSTNMSLNLRGVVYNVRGVRELDKFTIELTATAKEIQTT